MRLQQRLVTGLSVGFLMSYSAFAVAQNAPAGNQPTQQLPQPCVDAGVTAKAGCDALLKAAAGKTAAAKAAADKAASDQAAAKAAAAKAAADQASVNKAAADKPAAVKAAADQATANKAATDAAALKATADQAAANKAAAAKAAADQATANKAATDAAALKAAAGKAAIGQAATDKAAADKAAGAKAAAEQAAANKAAIDKAAAAKAATDKAGETQPTAVAPKLQGVVLPKDCLDAGLRSKQECDALHAIAGQKGKVTPTATVPANPPVGTIPAVVPAAAPTPSAPSGNLPTYVTPAKPAEQPVIVATPTLPDIASGLNAAAKSYNRGVATLGKAGSNGAGADKSRGEIKAAQAQLDALCKSNKFASTDQCLAQFAVQLSPIPVEAGGQQVAIAPLQPVEVIKNLPEGISQQDVAPLLDSAKDKVTGRGTVQPASQQPVPTPQTAAQARDAKLPPPKSDKAAQADFKSATVTPIDRQKGQQIDPNAIGQVQVPQNVTIINQTVVNNTTNITTNNTQNTNVPDTQANIDQGNKQGRQTNGRIDDHQPNNPIGLGFGIILQIGNQLIINSPAQDQRRIANNDQDHADYERLPGDRYRETIARPDGVKIVTIYNRNGDILRRSRFDRDGAEFVLAYFDDSHEQDLLQWRDPGEDLPPLRLRIPARDYVLDADEADQSQVQQFFAQPPVELVHRLYSIDEVKRSSRIRDMVRRLEIGNLTFDTGAATISQDQVVNLSNVGGAMQSLLEANPAETFLVEGHTDAIGSDIANLRLSDARAETVAQILTDYYHIPPENLATQGYGKRYLKVQTDLAEPLNRRVTIRRITSLVTVANN